jgi:nitrate/nitrite transporter NarK
MSIRQVFSGLSGVIGLPTIAFLIVHYGWRTACLSGGLFMWVVGLPLVYFFIRAKRPEYYGLLPDGAVVDASDNSDAVEAGKRYAAEAGEVEFTTKQAMSTRAFWMLIAAYMFHGALVPVMNIHAIPFLTDRGMEPFRAAATMSIYITASIPARFLGGFIVDRVTTTSIRFVMAGAYFLQAAGVILFLLNQQSMLSLYTFFIIYGLGMGAVMPMTPVIRARYFGRASFGTIAGISRAMNMPVGVVGPIAAGWIYDATGSYISAFILFAILLAVSGLIMAATGPPKPPVRSAELSAS